MLHLYLIDGASSTEGLVRWCNLTSYAESALSALHKLCWVCTFLTGLLRPRQMCRGTGITALNLSVLRVIAASAAMTFLCHEAAPQNA